MNLRLPEKVGKFLVAERLVGFLEGLSSMELLLLLIVLVAVGSAHK
jgi:hypothetical protein